MDTESRAILTVLQMIIWFLLSTICCGNESDIQCLKLLKQSLTDPDGILQNSWNFNNMTVGSICEFDGVECWHSDENKVLNLKLSNMGIQGQFPLGLEKCSSLTSLDLSRNDLAGPIPADIAKILPFVTYIDLSYNSFSGPIPASLSNCSYLNNLNLEHNQLSGEIPWQLGELKHLMNLNVADNQLTGPVPIFNVPVNVRNNPGLCGWPLDPCRRHPSTDCITGVITGSAVAGVLFTGIVFAVIVYCWPRKVSMKKKEKVIYKNKWAKDIKGAKDIKVYMFENSILEMKFDDLMKATNDFSIENIMVSGRTGTLFKAALLMVLLSVLRGCGTLNILTVSSFLR